MSFSKQERSQELSQWLVRVFDYFISFKHSDECQEISQRMARPPAEFMKWLLIMLVYYADVVQGASKDIGMKCPSICECSLTATPNVLCRGKFSLPGNLPSEAESFQCEDCPITNMEGNTFQNYTSLKKLRLSGDSSPRFDEQSLEDLRAIPEVVLERFNISAADQASLAGPNHTLVLVDIPRRTPPTSTAAAEVNPRRSGELPSPATTTTAGAGESPDATQRTSDSRLVVGGGGGPSTTDVPRSPQQPRDTRVLVIKEDHSHVFWMLGMAFAVVVTAALSSTVVWACMRTRALRLEHGYRQARRQTNAPPA